MTDTALVPSSAVARLAGLPVNLIDEAFGIAWQSFGRRTMVDAWHLGVELGRVKDGKGRHFRDYCRSICLDRSWAYRLLKIAEAPLSEVCSHATVEGAVKALKAAPVPTVAPAVEVVEHPVEVVVEPAPEEVEKPVKEHVEVVVEHVVEVEHPEDVIEAVVVEAEPTAADLRDERLERLAIITEGIDGDVVHGWALKHDRQAAREREHVAANKAADKRERAWKRERADMCDDALGLPPSPEAAAFLAKYWNVARPAA